MSIAIGLYDLFAYTIPGFLYLYVVYEIFRKLNIVKSEIFQLIGDFGIFEIGLSIIGAFVVGHLFEDLSHWLVIRLFRKKKWAESSMKRVREKYPELKIRFDDEQWVLIYSVLQQHNPQFLHTLNIFESNSIMLANFALGFLALAFLQLVNMIEQPTVINLLVFLVALLLYNLARKRSQKFHSWFYSEMFEGILAYGSSVEEIVAFNTEKKLTTVKRKTSRK